MNKRILRATSSLGLVAVLSTALFVLAKPPAGAGKPPGGIVSQCTVEPTGFAVDVVSENPVDAGRTVKGDCYALLTSTNSSGLMLAEDLVLNPDNPTAPANCSNGMCGPYYGTLRATTSRIDFIYTVDTEGCWPESLDYLHNGESRPCEVWLVVVGGDYDRKAKMVFFDEDEFQLATKDRGTVKVGVTTVEVDLQP